MAFEKLRAEPCFRELHDRLEAGAAPEKVAEWAQTSGGCMQAYKRASIVRTLYRYKKSMVPTAKAVVASLGTDGKPSLKMWERLQDMSKDVNEVEQLERLYLLQLSRINQGVDVEEQINFLDKNVRREIELAATMLEKSADLKMKLGLYKKAATELSITTTSKQAVESIPMDKRAHVQASARAVLAYLQAGTVPAVAEPAEPAAQDVDYEVVSQTGASAAS